MSQPGKGFLATRTVRIIALSAVGCAGAAALYAFLMPNWYEAQLSVVPGTPVKGTGALGALSSALPIDLPIEMSSSGSDAERIHAVLRSRSVTDAVIEKFKLVERYRASYLEQARKSLWTHCSTRLEKKPGVVTITCEDTDPEMVKQLTEYFGEYGNTVFRRISSSSAEEERRFLQQRVSEAKQDADTSSERLREFEEKHKVIDLPEQSKAVVSAMASLKGELLSKQLQLSYLSSFSSSEEATASQLRKQVAIMEAKMKSLEDDYQQKIRTGTDTKPAAQEHDDVFPPALSVPRLKFELAQYFLDQKLKETVYMMLTQRYEAAKIDAIRDTSAFQILDHATLPTHKSHPHRLLIILIGFFAGLIVSISLLVYGPRTRMAARKYLATIR